MHPPASPRIRPPRALAPLLGGALLRASGACEAPEPGPPQPAPPEYTLEVEESFDASSVPPYEGDHPEVYRYIDENQDRHLESLRSGIAGLAQGQKGYVDLLYALAER